MHDSNVKSDPANDQDFIDMFFNTIAKYDETIEKDLTDYSADSN